MNLNDYQNQAVVTAIYQTPVIYPMLGLCNEAGELAGKIKKLMRDNGLDLTAINTTSTDKLKPYVLDMRRLPNKTSIADMTAGTVHQASHVVRLGVPKQQLHSTGPTDSVLTPEQLESLKAEAGDVLWYLAALGRDLGLTLEEIAQYNLDKLQGRSMRGTLGGSGDKR